MSNTEHTQNNFISSIRSVDFVDILPTDISKTAAQTRSTYFIEYLNVRYMPVYPQAQDL